MREKIDYIDIAGYKASKEKITISKEMIGGLKILKVNFYNNYQKDNPLWHREMRRMKRKLRNYDYKDCAYGLNKKMEQVFHKEGYSFDSRKKELLWNKRDVFFNLSQGIREERKCLFIYVEGNMLTEGEIYDLLLAAKDYYQDIEFCYDGEKEKILSDMKKEWGVIVRVVDSGHRVREGTSGLYIAKNCGSDINRDGLENCYFIEETNRNLFKHEKCRKYSGYLYEIDGIRIPYQMAVNYLYHGRKKDKIILSSVAICEVK